MEMVILIPRIDSDYTTPHRMGAVDFNKFQHAFQKVVDCVCGHLEHDKVNETVMVSKKILNEDKLKVVGMTFV